MGKVIVGFISVMSAFLAIGTAHAQPVPSPVIGPMTWAPVPAGQQVQIAKPGDPCGLTITFHPDKSYTLSGQGCWSHNDSDGHGGTYPVVGPVLRSCQEAGDCWCWEAGYARCAAVTPTPFPAIEPTNTPDPVVIEPTDTPEAAIEPQAKQTPIPTSAPAPCVHEGIWNGEHEDGCGGSIWWQQYAADEEVQPVPTPEATVAPEAPPLPDEPQLPDDPAERAQYYKQRLAEIHAHAPGEPWDSTTAITLAVDADGQKFIFVSTSLGKVPEQIKDALTPNEEPADGPHQHGEKNGIQWAVDHQLTPVEVAAKWRICDTCADYLVLYDVTPASPLRNPEAYPELRGKQLPFGIGE